MNGMRPTDTPSYPSSNWTGAAPKCKFCGATPLPIGGAEGGATVHEDGCVVLVLTEKRGKARKVTESP